MGVQAGRMRTTRRHKILDDLIMNDSLIRSSALSKMFDGSRDIDDECQYPKRVTVDQYRYMYDREGIATRVVSIYPEECWATDPSIYETEDAEKTAWEDAFDRLNDQHNLIHYMQRIDEMSGIGSFGLLLMGIGDGKPLDQPVKGVILDGPNAGRPVGWKRPSLASTPPTPSPEPSAPENVGQGPWQGKYELLYLCAFDESQVAIASFVTDHTNRRYGQPEFYNITFNDPNTAASSSAAASMSTTTEKVHWTRVIHVADNRKSSEVYGTPRMQNVYNRLVDLRKLLGGSAEMFWKGAFPGFSFEVNPDLGDVDLDVEEMRQEFQAYANGLQRYLAISGVSAKSLAPQVAEPEAHVMVQIKAIAIATKTPLRIFMGSEAAHLASTQDKETWNNRLAQRQTKYLTPMLIRPFIDRLMAIGVLPMAEYHVDWPDLNTPSDEDKASYAETMVKAVAAYIQSGAESLIPPMEFLTIFLGMDSDQAEAVLDAALEHIEEMEDQELEERTRREKKGLPNPGDNLDGEDNVDDTSSDGGGDGQETEKTQT